MAAPKQVSIVIFSIFIFMKSFSHLYVFITIFKFVQFSFIFFILI